MENLCRLCGSEDGIKVDLFEPGSGRVKKIHKILPITVNEHDPFPNTICHHCSFKVDQFFEFRTTSIRAQEIFKRMIPWLRDRQLPCRNEDEPPMVQVAVNSINAISPDEKEISPSNGSVYMEDNMIVIEDSPPYVEHSNFRDIFVSESELNADTLSDEQQNPIEISKPKKSRSRSLWDTKKRKKKNRKSCRITEVFTTTEQEYQNFNNIENNPLRLSPVNDIENNSFDNIVENNSCSLKSPKNELSVVEKGILTDDRGGVNIALPKYILITKIPRVGNVYTCEKCGRTFLNPQPASLHSCSVDHSEDNGSKEEPQQPQKDEETETTKDYYQCNECGHMFTRHSQLEAHRKKHSNLLQELESSSDDSMKPYIKHKRRKHHTKRKPKPRLLDSSNFNSTSTFETSRSNFFFDFEAVQPNITRHSLLSSDSE